MSKRNYSQKRDGFESVESKEKVEIVVPEIAVAKPIYIGVATCNIDGVIAKDEDALIFKDAGENWETDKGLISKLYLLLKKI